MGPTIEILPERPEVAAALRGICEGVRDAGGRAFAVGGCVRDAALREPVRELDLEVFGLSPKTLVEVLSRVHPVEEVGRAFAVLKLRGLPIDVSVPRNRGEWDASAGPEEAAARRDFTLNAVAVDPLTGDRVDPFRGLDDLEARVLRHTSSRFVEDPLRVLRAMQLVARFDLDVAPETLAMCRSLRGASLARERVFEEWRKLLVMGKHPARGLAFLRACGWISDTPELEALIGCPQDPEWHPEGDVWVHTLHCLDAFAERRVGEEREDLIVGLAVLCHDLGKPAATAEKAGRITSVGHDRLGEAPTRAFLARMTEARDLIEAVVPLVVAHLAPLQLHGAEAGDAAVRRLARRVGRIDRLVRVARADHAGRPPLPAEDFPAGRWLLERARRLEVVAARPEPMVKGRHLQALGLVPGPGFAPILEACYEAQLDGAFEDLEGGRDFARVEIARRGDP